MNWTTAYGQRIPVEELTQQHLSNIYWYHRLLRLYPGMNRVTCEKIADWADTEIWKRFNSMTLPYRPTYLYEIDMLKKLGFIKGNKIWNLYGAHVGEIIPELITH